MKKPIKKPSINLPSLLNKPSLRYEIFHEKTKNNINSPQINPNDWPEEWKKIYYKGYVRFPEIKLPKPQKLKSSLSHALLARKSIRKTSPKKISLKKLSTLLYYSIGIKSSEDQSRFYPSAGARYPIEAYIISQNTDLENGLYHYYIKNHSLERLFPTKHIDLKKYFNEQWATKASCVILLTASFNRNTVKYGDRGYRYILTEVGHIGQNVCLLSTALNLSCCPYEGFIDNKVNSLLDLDGIKEGTVYTLILNEQVAA